MRHDPIFVIGRFRSGTTMFWNMLRASEEYTCYCEPCHEHLLDHVSKPPGPVDPTHTGVADYWREYRELPLEELREVWRPWFGRERFSLESGDNAADFARFLRYLIDSAPRTPVLKLVRFDFRVQWLRKVFPRATIIHVVRNPRSLWTSSVGRGSRRDDHEPEPHARWGRFVAYTEAIARDLGIAVAGHPYRSFYAVWRLSCESIGAEADAVWRYEDAVSDFSGWAGRHLVEIGLLPAVPTVVVRTDSLGFEFHSADWYAAQEREVERLLSEPSGIGPGFSPDGRLSTESEDLGEAAPILDMRLQWS